MTERSKRPPPETEQRWLLMPAIPERAVERSPDWQKRLRKVFAKAEKQTFAWGKHDCVTFAVACAEVVTGVPYARQIAEKYTWTSAAEALAVIQKAGGLEAIVSEFVGPSVPWGWCTAGDVVVAVNMDRELLAVHDGFQLVARGESGLLMLPVSDALVGWRL